MGDRGAYDVVLHDEVLGQPASNASETTHHETFPEGLETGSADGGPYSLPKKDHRKED